MFIEPNSGANKYTGLVISISPATVDNDLISYPACDSITLRIGT